MILFKQSLVETSWPLKWETQSVILRFPQSNCIERAPVVPSMLLLAQLNSSSKTSQYLWFFIVPTFKQRHFSATPLPKSKKGRYFQLSRNMTSFFLDGPNNTIIVWCCLFAVISLTVSNFYIVKWCCSTIQAVLFAFLIFLCDDMLLLTTTHWHIAPALKVVLQKAICPLRDRDNSSLIMDMAPLLRSEIASHPTHLFCLRLSKCGERLPERIVTSCITLTRKYGNSIPNYYKWSILSQCPGRCLVELHHWSI